MEQKKPLVSVLMPVYNAEEYVEEAINSITKQTFTDFELLIFNDGSKDKSSVIINSIKDERIRFFDSAENVGYVTHLNKGLQLAQGEYIARMDADDVSLPERFAQQVALLNSNPEVVLCGTAYDTIGSLFSEVKVPLGDYEIRNFMVFNCPIGHPTVMFRKSTIEQYGIKYDKDYMPAEDYRMWYEFSKVGKLHNLSTILLHYRIHPHQISSYGNAKQRQKATAIRLLQLSDKGFNFTEEEKRAYETLLDFSISIDTPQNLRSMMAFMQKILLENSRLSAYEPSIFLNLFRERWLGNLLSIKAYSPQLIPTILNNNTINSIGWKSKLKFSLKSLLYWKVRN